MIAGFFNILFEVIEFSICIDALLSWIPMANNSIFSDVLHTITEPFLKPGRKIQEMIMPGLMIDFSPIIAFLIIGILRRIVYTLLIFV